MLVNVYPFSVPLEQIGFAEWDSFDVSAGDYRVLIGLIDMASAFHAALIAHVEAYLILRIKFPCALVVLQWEADDGAEFESVLIVCVDLVAVVDGSIGGVSVFVSWEIVGYSNPVAYCTVPAVSAHQYGSVDDCRDVMDHGLDSTLDCILMVLIRGAGLSLYSVSRVEFLDLLGLEGCEIVGADDADAQAFRLVECEDLLETFEVSIFICIICCMTENMFSTGVAPDEYLSVAFEGLWTDGTHIVAGEELSRRVRLRILVVRVVHLFGG